MSLQVIKYTVRASSLQPKGDGCPTGVPHTYYYQTFGAFKTVTDVHTAKTEFLTSLDMQGLRPGDEEDASYRNTTYTKASYSGRGLRNTDGEPVYNAQEDHVDEFVEEDQVPGWA